MIQVPHGAETVRSDELRLKLKSDV